jgi:hypothetical protein
MYIKVHIRFDLNKEKIALDVSWGSKILYHKTANVPMRIQENFDDLQLLLSHLGLSEFKELADNVYLLETKPIYLDL